MHINGCWCCCCCCHCYSIGSILYISNSCCSLLGALALRCVCVCVFFFSLVIVVFDFEFLALVFIFFLFILCVCAHNSNSPFFYFMLMRSAFAMALSKMLVSCSILKILWNNIESKIDGYIVEFRFCKITTNPFILPFIRSPPSLSCTTPPPLIPLSVSYNLFSEWTNYFQNCMKWRSTIFFSFTCIYV